MNSPGRPAAYMQDAEEAPATEPVKLDVPCSSEQQVVDTNEYTVATAQRLPDARKPSTHIHRLMKLDLSPNQQLVKVRRNLLVSSAKTYGSLHRLPSLRISVFYGVPKMPMPFFRIHLQYKFRHSARSLRALVTWQQPFDPRD